MSIRIQYDGCSYYVQERVVGLFTGRFKWKTMSCFHRPCGIVHCDWFYTMDEAEQSARDEMRFREGMKTVKEFSI